MEVKELWDRIEKGEKRDEQEHDIKVFMESERIAKEYGIKWNGEDVLPDEEMADSLFNAAIEFLVSVGIHYVDEEKVIQITNDDVEALLQEKRPAGKIGEGNEAIDIERRKPCDSKRPVYVGGPVGGAVSEDIFKDLHESIAREDVYGIYTGSLETYDGVQYSAKNPMTLFTVWREVEWAREACINAGKPGLALFGPSSSSQAEQFLSVANPTGLRQSDVSEVYMPNEIKINRDVIVKVIHHGKVGNNTITGQCPILGIYAASPEGLAIVETAEALEGYLVVSPTIHSTGPVHMDYHASSIPEVLWASNIASLALSRNSELTTARIYWNLAGMATTMNLWETVAQVLSDIYTGREMIIGPVGRGANRPDMSSGFDSMFVNKVLDTFCGMSCDAIAESVERAVSRYRDDIPASPEGVPFKECYDGLKPKEEYLKMMEGVLSEIA
jgi:methylamine--corrinoid protein Co-methyltransferase